MKKIKRQIEYKTYILIYNRHSTNILTIIYRIYVEETVQKNQDTNKQKNIHQSTKMYKLNDYHYQVNYEEF